jgi:hypothetical protein
MIEILEMSPNSFFTIRLPYNLEDDLREISIRLDVTYFTPDGRFEFMSNPSIATELPVDVNVHDFFKSSLLFSRFQIRSSSGIPLQILDISLDGTDQFTVQQPPCTITPLLIFPSQPATFMYKIEQTHKTGSDLKSARQTVAEEQPLTLTIEYGCVDEYAIVAAETSFQKAVSGSTFAVLSPLLLRTFSGNLRKATSVKQYSEVALLTELQIPDYLSMKWNLLLDNLPPTLCAELRPWLQLWHEENKVATVSRLGGDGSATFDDDLTRTIIMNVPLPRLHILHTVSTTFPKSEKQVYSTGSLIPVTVTITHTRRWDTPSAFKSIASTPDAPLDFVFEIDAPNDAWLIGGQRRTKFTAKEDETKNWSFMIMPLRVGRLLLPTIDIRALGKGTQVISCEVDLRSLGETVVVIADLGSVTVGLSEGSTGGDAVLIESEERRISS